MAERNTTAEQLELSFMASGETASEPASPPPEMRQTKKTKKKAGRKRADAKKKNTKKLAKKVAKKSDKPKPTKKTAKDKQDRKPQRPYPQVTLAKALQVATKIKEFNGGNAWTPVDVAQAVEVGSKSPQFYYLTAASRDFGITTGTRDTPTIELTDLGREIVYAPNEEAERAKKREAFLKIDLFARVLNHYKGSTLPPMKYLGNTLTKEFGLDESHHEEFARVFSENCTYLGITEGTDVAEAEAGGTVVVGETKKPGLKAFVIMPFVERTDARPPGFFREVLKSLITPAGVDAGFNVETANRQGSDVIQSTIINDLLEADLVIADLTDHNPNVLFELGLRMAAEQKKPIALIKAKGTAKLFDIDNMLRVWEYRPELWATTLETDVAELKQHIEGAWVERDKRRSYLEILRNPAQPPVQQ